MCKRAVLIFLSLAALSFGGLAQGRVDVSKFGFTLDINTTEGSIGYRFDLRIDSAYIRPGNYVDSAMSHPDVEIRDLQTDRPMVGPQSAKIALKKMGVQIKVDMTEKSQDLLAALKSGQTPFYVFMDTALVLRLMDGTTLWITPERIKEISGSTKLSLTETQIDEIVDAKGGYYNLYGSKIDAGWRLGRPDSATAAGYLTFDFIQEILPGSLSRFGGIISSRLHDAATHFSFTPIIYNPFSGTPAYVSASYEVSQDGSAQRVFGSVSYQNIIPNFIDLSRGYNRLRLKPLVKVGINLYSYTKSPDSLVYKKTFAEPSVDISYYIPVLERYSISFNGSFFWRSDKDFNFIKSNAAWNGDVSLEYEVPGAGTKVMAKFAFGTNSLTFQKDDKLLIGLLVDFIERK